MREGAFCTTCPCLAQTEGQWQGWEKGGFRAGQRLHETPLETWDSLLNLNARSVFIACQQVIPHMINQGSGKITNIAARPGIEGQPGMAAYSASKSAVLRLTESMSAELKDQGINVKPAFLGSSRKTRVVIKSGITT